MKSEVVIDLERFMAETRNGTRVLVTVHSSVRYGERVSRGPVTESLFREELSAAKVSRRKPAWVKSLRQNDAWVTLGTKFALPCARRPDGSLQAMTCLVPREAGTSNPHGAKRPHRPAPRDTGEPTEALQDDGLSRSDCRNMLRSFATDFNSH